MGGGTTEPGAAGRRPARAGTTLAAAAVGTMTTVALLGPSSASPTLTGPGPTRSLGVHPSAPVVTVAMWAALGCAAAAVACWWLALHRGWLPSVRRTVVWGVIAAALMAAVPPLGSDDVLAYGVYGRMVVLGIDPYTTDIDDLAARGDPIGQQYRGGWSEADSVYGPVAVAVTAVASFLSGDSLARFVVVMQLVALAVFLATGWLLLRAAGPDPPQRARVALLWLANPLLQYLVVNAAHIDAVAVALGVSALLVLRRSPATAGVLVALAACTKVSYGLYAAAMVWALRRDRPALTRLLLSASATGLVVLAPVLPRALEPLRTASTYVARESPWRAVELVVDVAGGSVPVRALSVAAWLVVAGAAWRLRLLVPRRASGAPVVDDAVRAAVLLSAAWLLATTYALPWYDVIAWAPLLLLPASPFDALLFLRTAVVSLAYVPGAVLRPPGTVGAVTSTVRGVVAPAVSVALLAIGLVAPARLRPGPAAGRPAEPSSAGTGSGGG